MAETNICEPRSAAAGVDGTGCFATGPSSGGAAGRRFLLAGIGALACALMATGCRDEMYDQQKLEPLEMTTFFADSQASRPLASGTIPRGTLKGRSYTNAGGLTSDSAAPGLEVSGATDAGGTPLSSAEVATMAMPIKATKEVLLRGQERYNIYCSPCHGRTGDGQGMIVQRGFPAPPSFHLDRLREAPDGHYYDVITRGFGVMYSYANRVKPADRWNITAYIRALQLSRNATAAAP